MDVCSKTTLWMMFCEYKICTVSAWSHNVIKSVVDLDESFLYKKIISDY